MFRPDTLVESATGLVIAFIIIVLLYSALRGVMEANREHDTRKSLGRVMSISIALIPAIFAIGFFGIEFIVDVAQYFGIGDGDISMPTNIPGSTP